MIRFKTLKPGSILIYKNYNIFKKLWYRLIKKDLPYNKAVLFTDYITIFDSFSPNSPTLLLTPKKSFSDEECKKLINLAEEFTSENDIYAITFKNKDFKEMFTLLSRVRPLSGMKDVTEKDFFEFKSKLHKNYYVKRIAEETNWDIHLF